MSTERRIARSHYGTAASRASRRPDDPTAAATAEEAHRTYKAAELADHIRRLVDTAPPLTDEQRSRLAALLLPTCGGGGPAV